MNLPDHEDRRRALTDFQRNLVVTAGAGTGKTSLLVGRLLAALVRHRLEPHEILAVTFTENAAQEMHERLCRMLEGVRPFVAGEAVDASDAYVFAQLQLGPEDLSRVDDLLARVETVRISTFHGFCLRFLQEAARRLDLPPDLRVGEGDGRTGFEEVFLACLKEATEGEVHPALHRFEPTELQELVGALLELPEESLDRVRDARPPDDLAPRLGALEALIAAHGNARGKWQEAAGDLARGYRALLAGERFTSPWLDRKRAIPKAGKREVGAELSEELAEALAEHRAFLTPWLEADDAAVAVAVDFARPVLARHRREAALRGELSFQDLLLLTRQYLIARPDLRRQTARQLKAILVDEFQDTDPLQYDVVFLLAAQEREDEDAVIVDPMQLRLRRGVLFIVGDAKQSIYRFRRADVAAFARAVRCVEEQDGRRLELTANFRSHAPILDLVNAVCARSLAADPPYQFGYQPVHPMLQAAEAAPVEVLQVDADRPLRSEARREREGHLIVERIAELHGEGVGYGDMAVLLRAATDTSWILRPLRAAGIPYVVEGSRRFYQRHEVILASALIGAMARPHDPVAVLAVLRSALSGAADAEILEYVESGRSLDFREPDRGGGAVRGCLRLLGRLHAEVRDLPVDAALTRLLTLPELQLAEAAGFEGAQRLANLERLLHRLLQRAPLDLVEAATFLARQTGVETDDEESPLFDAGVAAVRVMTVHKSKGLEFDVVFVPDLARRQQFQERHEKAQAQRLFDAAGTEQVTVRIGDVRNAASLLARDADRRHEAAETRRLFYVAATRARRRLILVCGEPARETRPWQDDLEAIDQGALVRRLRLGTDSARARRDREFDPAPALAAAAAHRRAQEELGPRLRQVDVAPSRQHGEAGDRQLTFSFAGGAMAGGEATGGAPTESPPEDAAATGSAMHVYLGLVDVARSTPDEDLLDRLGAGAELRAMAAGFHASAVRDRLAGARRLHREIPLAFVEGDRQVHGVVDVVLEEAGGNVTVLDWKTDRVDPGGAAAHADRYRDQLRLYGRGVQRALGLPEGPRLEVHFLRCDRTVRL